MSNDSKYNVRELEVIGRVNKIGGHLMDSEIISLYNIAGNLPDNSKILEIGSYRGKSANAIGYSIKNTKKTLYCLDIWKDYVEQSTGPMQTDNTLKENEKNDLSIISDFITNTNWFSENMRLLKGSTKDFYEFLPRKFFDMVFIDGAHDYTNVCFDINIGFEILKSNGILCGHDYHEGLGGEDIKRATHELVFDNPRVKEYNLLPGTTIWIAIIK